VLAKCRILGALCAGLLVGCAFPSGASAVVVHGPGGQFLGVAPRSGVAPAAIPGSVAAASPTVSPASASWENLSYRGGPVVHSSRPYLVYWAATGETIDPSWQSLIQSYFSDVAADSTKATNVYAVARQFTDHTGFADYQQTFDPTSQVIQDVDSYPATDATVCSGSPYATCLSDQQLQDELSTLIATNGLPSDGPDGATSLPAAAPIYFIVLPSDVDVCYGDGTCASNDFCAYHSSYVDAGNDVLYAAIPLNQLESPEDPKACQWDGNSQVQEPGGSLADVALKYISHEDNETITDPLGNGWWNGYTGNEDGDNCNDIDWSPNAFTPTLGGDASAGTLYNQVIAGDDYYLQSEWSNGGSTCLMEPSSTTMTPRFSVPANPRTAGSALTFDPSASTSPYGFSSETWSFGDGTATSFHAGSKLTAATHTYAAAGNYTVTLTLVDKRGNLSSASEKISVAASPTAAFSASSTQVVEGAGPLSFDATGSSTAAPATLDSYAWDFGDGASAQGATASHTYATAGSYLVRLTITDSAGNVDTATQTVTVTDEPPVAALAIAVRSPEAGQSVGFDGSSSSDADGSITSYAWAFGDGHTGSGRTASHTYASPGTYALKLTVTDSSGQHASITQSLTVFGGPTAHLAASATQVEEGASVDFDATGSAAGGSGASIQTYAWSFGDGTSATGAAPSHAYSAPASYTVKLTVTDSAGVSATTTQTVTVLDEPPAAAFGASPAVPIPGQSIAFDGSGSSESDGAIVSYAWDFGDGATGTGATPTHAFATAGTFTVTLTVVDQAGQQGTVSRPITVYAQPQSTFGYSPELPVAGVANTFTAASNAGTTASYAWSFGDGTTATGASVAHAYAHQGTYRVTLTATDGLGITSTTSEVVTVIEAPPTAVITLLSGQRFPGRAIVFSGARSHGADGPIVSYMWHFGGRGGGVGRKLSHSFAWAGSYHVSLTVRDSFGQSATTTVTIRVGRTAPISRARQPSRRRRRRKR
jgi:PKD repeat protein